VRVRTTEFEQAEETTEFEQAEETTEFEQAEETTEIDQTQGTTEIEQTDGTTEFEQTQETTEFQDFDSTLSVHESQLLIGDFNQGQSESLHEHVTTTMDSTAISVDTSVDTTIQMSSRLATRRSTLQEKTIYKTSTQETEASDVTSEETEVDASKTETAETSEETKESQGIAKYLSISYWWRSKGSGAGSLESQSQEQKSGATEIEEQSKTKKVRTMGSTASNPEEDIYEKRRRAARELFMFGEVKSDASVAEELNQNIHHHATSLSQSAYSGGTQDSKLVTWAKRTKHSPLKVFHPSSPAYKITPSKPPKKFKLPSNLLAEDADTEPEQDAVPAVDRPSLEQLAAVDAHAQRLAEGRTKPSDLRELVWQLVGQPNVTDSMERLRLAFVWLCLATPDACPVQREPQSAEALLSAAVEGRAAMAVALRLLCRAFGLDCRLVQGSVRGGLRDPAIGDAVHLWNAVRLNGSWRLIDSFWAARGYGSGGKQQQEAGDRQLDEFYFLARPAQFVFTHFPDRASWQLLEKPLTIARFNNLAQVKNAFFKYGLELRSHPESTIQWRSSRPGAADEDPQLAPLSPALIIRIGVPPGLAGRLSFIATLSPESKSTAAKAASVKHRVLHLFDRRYSCLVVAARPPSTGTWKLTIYARDLAQTAKSSNSRAPCSSQSACIKSTRKSIKLRTTSGYGPADANWSAMGGFNLTAVTAGEGADMPLPIVEVTDGQAEDVRFKLSSRAAERLRYVVKLRGCDQQAQQAAGRLADSASCIVRMAAGHLLVRPLPPTDGLHVLEAPGWDRLHLVQQLLLVCRCGTDASEALHQPPGHLGGTQKAAEFGLACTSHEDPLVSSKQPVGDDPAFEFSMKPDRPLRLAAHLVRLAASGSQSSTCSSDCVLQEIRQNDGAASFRVWLPAPGYYKLVIFGLPATEKHDNLANLWQLLICAPKRSADSSAWLARSGAGPRYPLQFAAWSEGCSLRSPTSGQLAASDRAVDFSLIAPEARAVSVVCGESWTSLKPSSQAAGQWLGRVSLAAAAQPGASRVAVCANYAEGDAKKFRTLLEYKVQAGQK
uniref:TGc domain-containing protein n=1 Tax=Macrostomum lignano TaxID=282301 RepID=A0A1I8FY85_9PLAT